MIETREVTYEVDGLNMVAHLARPTGEGPRPAVLLGHDGVGLDGYQRDRANDLAAHGYIALAMDYHGGEVFFGKPDAMLARTMPLLADDKRMQAVGHAALDALLAVPGVDANCMAALGYGAGGRIVLELARTGTPFKAIVAVHPAFPAANASSNWADVTGTFFLCTGSEDPICSPEQVLAFGKILQDAGIEWRAEIYGGAKHAFWAKPTNSDGSPSDGQGYVQVTVPGVGYHPKHTSRAWAAVLNMFGETFQSSAGHGALAD